MFGEREGKVSWLVRVLVMERGGRVEHTLLLVSGSTSHIVERLLSYSVLSSILLHYAYGNDVLLLVNGYRSCYCVIVAPDPRSWLESKWVGFTTSF